MVRAKVKLVTRGSNKVGVDLFESAVVPTTSASCLRLLGATACELRLDLCHFDAEQAFIKSNLEEVFMRMPQGCGEMSCKMVRLNGSLHGLKHASRSWHDLLSTHMKSLKFEQCPAHACVVHLIESLSQYEQYYMWMTYLW